MNTHDRSRAGTPNHRHYQLPVVMFAVSLAGHHCHDGTRQEGVQTDMIITQDVSTHTLHFDEIWLCHFQIIRTLKRFEDEGGDTLSGPGYAQSTK